MNWLSYLLAAAAGAANSVQTGANSELKKCLTDPIWPTVWVYISGLFGMLVIQAFVRAAWPSSSTLAATPWWAWIGGVLSIASTMAALTFAQKMGSGTFTGISITAALIASVVLDNFGWVGFKPHAASWPRIGGSALMITGLWLVAKF